MGTVAPPRPLRWVRTNALILSWRACKRSLLWAPRHSLPGHVTLTSACPRSLRVRKPSRVCRLGLTWPADHTCLSPAPIPDPLGLAFSLRYGEWSEHPLCTRRCSRCFVNLSPTSHNPTNRYPHFPAGERLLLKVPLLPKVPSRSVWV